MPMIRVRSSPDNVGGSPGHLLGRLDDTATIFVSDQKCNNAPTTCLSLRELNRVLHMLWFDEQYDHALKNCGHNDHFCCLYPEGCVNNNQACIYLYRREWLDQHIEQSEKGIRLPKPCIP